MLKTTQEFYKYTFQGKKLDSWGIHIAWFHSYKVKKTGLLIGSFRNHHLSYFRGAGSVIRKRKEASILGPADGYSNFQVIHWAARLLFVHFSVCMLYLIR